MIKGALYSLLGMLPHCSVAAKPEAPAAGERIVFLGNGLGERFLDHPWFETELQLRYPEKDLVVRILARPGDTPGFRPHPSRGNQWAFPGAEEFHPGRQIHAGSGRHPSPDQWLETVKVDTIFAFFGYNESFDGSEGLEGFKNELVAFVDHTLSQRYNGGSAPRLILVSPIGFEDLSASRDLPDGKKENKNLALYSAAMGEIAKDRGVEFIDVFKPSLQAYADRDEPLTRNGFLPNDLGYQLLGVKLVNEAFGKAEHQSKAEPAAVSKLIRDKNWHWFHDYRMLNGVHVDGRRYEPFGPQNYPAETEKVRSMTRNRDEAIHALINGSNYGLAAADASTPKLPPVPTNYGPERMAMPEGNEKDEKDSAKYLYDEKALAALDLPEGFEIGQFASEKEFPNLANPCQLSFDNEGRLWVSSLPSYRHWRPGDPKPDDKILIYEAGAGDQGPPCDQGPAGLLHGRGSARGAPDGVRVRSNMEKGFAIPWRHRSDSWLRLACERDCKSLLHIARLRVVTHFNKFEHIQRIGNTSGTG